ncbi:MAG: energy transducer TonB [Bacteroidia bacterium]
MKTILTQLILILTFSISSAQSNRHVNDSLKEINSLLKKLPKCIQYQNYVKYELEFSNITEEINLKANYFDLKSNKKAAQYNITKFRFKDIDPNGIVIKDYDKTHIMLQLISKNNAKVINNIFFIDDIISSNTYYDRVSIDFFNRESSESLLVRIKSIFSYFLKIQQESLNSKNDNTEENAMVAKEDVHFNTIDSLDIRKQESAFIFGVMEKSPTFLDSRNNEETEKKVKNYLDQEGNKINHHFSGKIYIQFIIDKNGFVINPLILKKGETELENIALEVVSKMPAWKPGTVNGNPVNTKFATNIEFN